MITAAPQAITTGSQSELLLSPSGSGEGTIMLLSPEEGVGAGVAVEISVVAPLNARSFALFIKNGYHKDSRF